MRRIKSRRKWSLICWGILGLIAGLGSAPAGYAAPSVNGYIENYQVIRLDGPNEFLSSRTGGRLELLAENQTVKGFLSGDFFYDAVAAGDGRFDLREAYVDYQLDHWGWRVGRQIIAWGKADGIQVTDLICPIDYRDYFCREFSDAKKAVEAAKTSLRVNNMLAEVVLVPFFEPVGYPDKDNPWLRDSATIDAIVVQPERNFQNSEWFGRIAFDQAGFDFGFSAFYCWWDTPVYQGKTVDGAPVFWGEYYRVHGLGGEISFPLGELVLRGEAVWVKERRFERDSYFDGYCKSDTFNLLLGADWYPGSNWMVSGQVNDEMLLNYDHSLSREQHSWLGTLKITKKLLRETLDLTGQISTSLREKDYYLKLSVEYSLTDNMRLSSGLLLFDGDAAGTFGRYRDQDGFMVKLKYSF
jgi:hypothetical protein